MEFHKVEIRIQCRAVIGECGFVNDISEGDRSFVYESLPGPDSPNGLSGPPIPPDHKKSSPSVPRGG